MEKYGIKRNMMIRYILPTVQVNNKLSKI